MDIKQVTETIAMIEEQNFDVRTITMGISLLDCIDSDIDKAAEKVYNKIVSLHSFKRATKKVMRFLLILSHVRLLRLILSAHLLILVQQKLVLT